MSAAERFSLRGRTAVVTGGSRGLGRAMVHGLAESGADVVIVSRTFAACEELAAEVAARHGVRALPYACHVGRWQQLDALVEAAWSFTGRVDVWVNNAGMSPVYDRLVDVDEKLFDSVVNLNFKGPFRLCALVGHRMAAAGGGSIINISSTGSIRPEASIVPYAAAKAALNTVTVGVAAAYGPLVRCNAVMAGPFRTDATAGWADDVHAAIRSHALQRIGEPDEVVGAVLYLASDASSYTTGAIVRVDGGIP